jgi:hypothetical protein
MCQGKIAVGRRYILPDMYGMEEITEDRKIRGDAPQLIKIEGEVEVVGLNLAPETEKFSLGYAKLKSADKGTVAVIDLVEIICAVNGLHTDKLTSEDIHELGRICL